VQQGNKLSHGQQASYLLLQPRTNAQLTHAQHTHLVVCGRREPWIKLHQLLHQLLLLLQHLNLGSDDGVSVSPADSRCPSSRAAAGSVCGGERGSNGSGGQAGGARAPPAQQLAAIHQRLLNEAVSGMQRRELGDGSSVEAQARMGRVVGLVGSLLTGTHR
jgi:hypothetical protein